MLSCAILTQQETVNASVTTIQQLSPNTTSNSTFNSNFSHKITDKTIIVIVVCSVVVLVLFCLIKNCCLVFHGECFRIRGENPTEYIRLIFRE